MNELQCTAQEIEENRAETRCDCPEQIKIGPAGPATHVTLLIKGVSSKSVGNPGRLGEERS